MTTEVGISTRSNLGPVAAGYIAAYLRVSHAEEDGRTFEEQQATQRGAIGRLVERNGDKRPVREFVDWDRSADPAKEHQREGLNAMLRAVERGEVAAVYASSLDRLYRSMSTFLRIVQSCKSHNVRVVTERDGILGGDGSPMAMAFSEMTAVFAGLELNTAKARAKSRVARQRAEGVQLGEKPYGSKPNENLPAVIQAFVDAGSYNGAAVLLNERRVRPRRGKRWESITISRIVKRAALSGRLPHGMTLPIDPRPRSRTLSKHIFAGLVRCPHDGSILTSTWRTNRAGKAVGLLCRIGRVTSDHPRPYSMPEHVVLKWAEVATAEVLARRGVGEQAVVIDADGNVIAGEPQAEDVIARIGALREMRRRLVRAYTRGDLSDADYDGDIADLDRQLDGLANEQRSVAAWQLPIQWTCPEGVSERAWKSDLNVRLRDLLQSIRLNAEMRPMGAVWRRRPIASDGSGVFMLDEESGEQTGDYDARAIPVTGGWFLPTATPRGIA